LPTEPPKLAVADLPLGDYEGNYRYAPERTWKVSSVQGELRMTTRPGAKPNLLQPIARDVFMGSDDERNLFIFRRGADGKVNALIERRKFNDLRLDRVPPDVG
jgi:hypothetical protein